MRLFHFRPLLYQLCMLLCVCSQHFGTACKTCNTIMVHLATRKCCVLCGLPTHLLFLLFLSGGCRAPGLLAQAAMAVLSLRNTHRVIDGIMALTLYPLSLMVVAGLEACGWD